MILGGIGIGNVFSVWVFNFTRHILGEYHLSIASVKKCFTDSPADEIDWCSGSQPAIFGPLGVRDKIAGVHECAGNSQNSIPYLVKRCDAILKFASSYVGLQNYWLASVLKIYWSVNSYNILKGVCD